MGGGSAAFFNETSIAEQEMEAIKSYQNTTKHCPPVVKPCNMLMFYVPPLCPGGCERLPPKLQV